MKRKKKRKKKNHVEFLSMPRETHLVFYLQLDSKEE
jgi:hypothetical protein